MMNKSLKQVAATAGLMIATVASSFAQTADRARIDFPFLVGKTSMPAGMYEVVRENLSGGTTFLKLSSGRTKSALTIPRFNGNHQDNPSLTFRCVAVEICSLVAVKTGNGSTWAIPAPELTPAQAASAREIVVSLQPMKAD